MKIKRIKFQNYTVFEDQQMEFSPGINVIIGAARSWTASV